MTATLPPSPLPLRLWSALDRGVGAVSFALTAVGSLAVVSFMVLICVDVILRRALNMPLQGVSDYVAYTIVAVVFFQLGSSLRHGRLISADFLMTNWERRPVLAEGLKSLFFGIIVVLMWRVASWLYADAWSAWNSGDFTGAVGAFRMPVWPFKAATALGAAVALVEAVLVALRHLARFAFALRESGALRRGGPGLVIALAILALALALLFWGGLTRVQVGFLGFAGLFLLVIMGMPVAFTLIAVSFVTIWAIRGNMAISDTALGLAASTAIRSFEFGVVPLFVLMGLVLERADVGRDAFRVAVVLLRRMRGGLANATVAANAVFAAITGSSIASAAVFSRIAVPPMVEAGYTKRFAVGVVAGSSVLGMLIPPSILLIIYGLLAQVSVGALFVAAIVPGILLALCFGLLNTFLVTAAPRFVGDLKSDFAPDTMSLREMSVSLAPVAALIALVMGGIYGGLFSPTEAGAVGAAGAFVIAAVRGRLTWAIVRAVIHEAGYITSGILFLILAASLYSRMLAISTIPMQVTTFIGAQNLTLIAFCLAYLVIVILLGMILDSVSIMMIMLPIAMPVVLALGGDPIWFGIVTVVAIEIGLLTPPFGLSVFVVKGTLPDGFVRLGEVFSGVAPYVVTMFLFTLLLIFVPAIALVLL